MSDTFAGASVKCAVISAFGRSSSSTLGFLKFDIFRLRWPARCPEWALGHTGRSLISPKLVVLSYLLFSLVATTWVYAPAFSIDYLTSMAAAGVSSLGAFLLFVVVYTPILILRRADGSQDRGRAWYDGVPSGAVAMDTLTISRALHVLAIVLWIGGVAIVTTVLLPAVRRFKSDRERLEFFESVEGRFAWQARFMTFIAGITGFYMTYLLDAWDRFLSVSFWWMHAMVGVWVLFTFMLFIAEPLFLHSWFRRRAEIDLEGTFALIRFLHWGLLTISLITILGAVAGSHGMLLF